MTWKLYLDNRKTPDEPGWTIARTSLMAIVVCVQHKEMPEFISLNHLGDEDDIMIFLKELHHIWESSGAGPSKIPKYVIHSDDVTRSREIVDFMESWKNPLTSNI